MIVVVYPLLAEKFTFLKGPIFNFSNDHYLASISESDHGTILRYCPDDYQGVLKSRFRCIYFNAPDDVDEVLIASTGKLVAYSLNYFCGIDPIDFPMSISIQSSGRRRIAKFNLDTSTPVSPSKLKYRLSDGTNAGELQKVFSLTSAAMKADSRVSIMIDRYNSALRREKIEDKIIDLSVALEAMLNETTEVAFRLSLYLSFICQQDRNVAYELFRTLYNVRSKIVHGSLHEHRAQQALNEIEGKMGDLLKCSKLAMLYYFNFLNSADPREWSKHCLSLVLGTQQPNL